MRYLQTITSFINHKLSAIGRHGAHSPFVYDLIEHVFQPKINSQIDLDLLKIEQLRKKLLSDQRIINVLDLGAGSKILNDKKRKIADIAKVSLKKPKEAILLLRLAKHLNCRTILELGTSLGITTLYLSETSTNCRVYTMEGCPETGSLAKKNFEYFDKKNIQLIEGNIDSSLPQLLGKINKIDMVLFDGNHAKNPTLSYFKLCIENISEKTVFIFDDINWNQEMQEAWTEICQHPKVTLSIDCWQLGLVFFHKNREKQQFNIGYR